MHDSAHDIIGDDDAHLIKRFSDAIYILVCGRLKMRTTILVVILVLALSCAAAEGLDMKILHGTYMQPDLLLNWTGPESFRREFAFMREVHMDHIIIQWLLNSKSMKAWYPTSLPGYKILPKYDTVEAALSEGAKQGISVWLGLNDNDDWWVYSASNEPWLVEQFGIGKKMVSEMWSKYGGKYANSIAGFYLVFEMDNMAFTTDVEQDRMARMYKDTCDYVHKLTGKPVMVAPYYLESVARNYLNATEYAKMWGKIVKKSGVDVVAMQDGENCCGLGHLSVWFPPMRAAIKAARPATQFWTDLETFILYPNETLIPAPISRVVKQIEIESHYVDKITSFSFTMLDSPQQGHSKEYYQYLQYVRHHARREKSD